MRGYAGRSFKRLVLELLISAVGLSMTLLLVHRASEAIKENAVRMAQHAGTPGQ